MKTAAWICQFTEFLPKNKGKSVDRTAKFFYNEGARTSPTSAVAGNKLRTKTEVKQPMKPWEIALLVVYGLSILLTVYDKCVAGGRRRRVPEQVFFILALLGGSFAMYLTMLLIRHKTKHKRFMLGLPLIMAVQIALYYLLV